MTPATAFAGRNGERARIGIFGGTFDPPHQGHLEAARAARDALDLDAVYLVVANDPWQKSVERAITPAFARLEMVRALAEDEERLIASAIEIERSGPSYTIDTVEEFLARAARLGAPEPALYLVVGADLAGQLHTWERARTLAARVVVAVVTRPGEGTLDPPEGWRSVVVDGVSVDLASSQIRASLADGHTHEDLVGAAVMRVIEQLGLYTVVSDGRFT